MPRRPRPGRSWPGGCRRCAASRRRCGCVVWSASWRARATRAGWRCGWSARLWTRTSRGRSLRGRAESAVVGEPGDRPDEEAAVGDLAPVVLAVAIAASASALLVVALLHAGRTRRLDLDRREQRLSAREERLDDRGRQLDQRTEDLTRRESALVDRSRELDRLAEERRHALEAVAGLTADDA